MAVATQPDEKVATLLKQHTLKVTPVRTEVLKVLVQNPFALSQNEIEQAVSKNLDRITLYRTLKSFEEKGLVHRVYNSFGEAKYALCHADCGIHHHNDEHIHLNCVKCRKTVCFDHIHIPSIPIPDGVKVLNYNFSIEGICAECSSKK